ncbi:MAG: hypothetical protein HY586_05130 [Candidatus Omnitrophica bacterium]|nr:hypothetical protein [Candidatus Omnitrophota bacterium]
MKLSGQIRYEIRMFEALLEQKPNYVDALSALADIYTKTGEIQKGLALDERLARLCPESDSVFYNLACSYSLAGQLKKAYSALKRAVSLGYADLEHLHHDSDLEALRKSQRFGPMVKKLLIFTKPSPFPLS